MISTKNGEFCRKKKKYLDREAGIVYNKNKSFLCFYIKHKGSLFFMTECMMNEKKRIFPTELAYVFGVLFLGLGTALMERAGFGVSMVVAPAYLLHLKISEFLPFFSFGMAEYTFQAILLLSVVLLVGRMKLWYLLSFVTAVLYGFILDGAIALWGLIPGNSLAFRIFCYGTGMVLCSAGIAMLFNTYITPEAYELFVKELAEKYQVSISRCKTIYDCVSCLIAIVLSFSLFGMGNFVGVKWGTIVCALINGWLIGKIAGALQRKREFRDALPYRKFFQG